MPDASVVILAADPQQQEALRAVQALRAPGHVEEVTTESGEVGWRITRAGMAHWRSLLEGSGVVVRAWQGRGYEIRSPAPVPVGLVERGGRALAARRRARAAAVG